MKGQGAIAMPIARLFELAGAGLRVIRKAAAARKAEAGKPAPAEDAVAQLYFSQFSYDNVWGGKATTGVYVVGRADDSTYRFVCFL